MRALPLALTELVRVSRNSLSFSQQQQRLREENGKRFQEEREKFKRAAAQQGETSGATPAWMNTDGNGQENSELAADPQGETQELKMKRSDVAKKVMPLASSQMMRELLKDLCENADEQTLNIIIKHVG